MTEPREAYRDLSDWVDVTNHPDKVQFDNLLSSLIQAIIGAAIAETRKDANSGTEHIDLIQDYAENKGYERFFTPD